MKPLAEPAIEAVKSGEVRFIPDRWSKIYFNWMENIQDWCISRQLWWGHRIPAYTCPTCGELVVDTETPHACPKCGYEGELEQDPDVLDTWFSSWLWPFSTLGWPEKTKDLEYYYPTTDLVTAQDLIFFWVARMMMAGIHFMKKPPFKNIVIHGIVRAADGSKMSKSKGNSLDPLELIEAYSADALRFSIALITSLECDTKVNKEKFEIGRNFTTKIWNAAKFIEMNLADGRSQISDLKSLTAKELTADDRHMLIACDKACRRLSEILESYRIQDGALAVYDFFWTQICDWYVEYVKDDLNSGDAKRQAQVLAMLADVFSKALCLLLLYMPFVTEEVAHQLGYLKDGETIMKAKYPTGYSDADKKTWGLSEEVFDHVNAKREMITAGRALRAEYQVAPAKFVNYVIAAKDADTAKKLVADLASLRSALRSEKIDVETDQKERAMPGTLTKLGTIYMPLEGLVDKAAESKRIAAELVKDRGFIKGIEAKLANANFVDHAPPKIVANQREKLVELQAAIAKLEKLAKLFA